MAFSQLSDLGHLYYGLFFTE